MVVFNIIFFLPARHQNNGSVIARCGQPEVSWWGWRNADDEHLVQSIARASASDGSRSSPGKLSSSPGKMASESCTRSQVNEGVLSEVDFGKKSLQSRLIYANRTNV